MHGVESIGAGKPFGAVDDLVIGGQRSGVVFEVGLTVAAERLANAVADARVTVSLLSLSMHRFQLLRNECGRDCYCQRLRTDPYARNHQPRKGIIETLTGTLMYWRCFKSNWALCALSAL